MRFAAPWLVAAVLALGACARGPRRDGGGPPAETAAASGNGCGACHEEEVRFHAYGGHETLSCDDCHGDPGRHAEPEISPRPEMRVGGNEQCLDCHDLAKAAAGDAAAGGDPLERHLRFLKEKHFIKIDRAKVKGRCIHCHDPHLGQ